MSVVERHHDPGIEEGGSGGAVGNRKIFSNCEKPVVEVPFGKIIRACKRRLRIGDAAAIVFAGGP